MDSRLPKGEYPKRKYLRAKRHGLSIFLAVFLGIMTFSTALAEAAGPSAMRFYSSNPGTIVIEQLAIKDSEGNSIAIGQEEDFAASVSGILAGLDAGEVSASQSAQFASAEDEQKGIIKNIVDIAADPIRVPTDLVIVLDVSGSMSEVLPRADSPSAEDTRFTVAKQAVLQLSESVLSQDRNNRISIIVFSTGVNAALAFSSDKEAINGFVSGLSIGGFTNYESGLNQAEAFLSGRTGAEIERKSSVVLITDGQPNRGDALAGANRLKSNTNADLYCVGIQSGASELLHTLATDDSHFRDCATADEFMEYMSQVTRQLSLVQSATIWSGIGSGFDLFCSEAYPITIGEDVYFSIDDVPSDQMLLTNEQRRMQWNIPAVDRSGVRLSYYTLLTDEARADLSEHPIPVSNAGSLEYRLYYRDDNGTIKTADESTLVTLPAYSVSKESSVLTATIFSDKMETGDTLVGRPLKYADEIQYTVRLENTGQLTAENIVIGANIPDGTEYVSGINATPDYDKQVVSSPPLSLLPGTTEEISFVVRVCIQEGTIVNAGFLNLILPGHTATEPIKTYELTNPVMANSPEPEPPQPTLPVTEPPQPTPPVSPPSLPSEPPAISTPVNPRTGSLVISIKMMDTAEASPFSLVVELSDDSITGKYGDAFFVNGKAEFVLSYDATKTVKDLPAGIIYTAQIASSLPYTFRVGETDTRIASGTITEDTTSEVVFNVYYSGENVGSEEDVPSGTPSVEQPTLDKDHEVNAIDNSFQWLLLVIVVLCIVLTAQIINIRSDLCVLRWYRAKKAESSKAR